MFIENPCGFIYNPHTLKTVQSLFLFFNSTNSLKFSFHIHHFFFSFYSCGKIVVKDNLKVEQKRSYKFKLLIKQFLLCIKWLKTFKMYNWSYTLFNSGCIETASSNVETDENTKTSFGSVFSILNLFKFVNW